ncbi:unnamed protein product [Closterium sp. Naga37s-1]|nr:unnamed protein product [Closterium sp. Naga37s-1]
MFKKYAPVLFSNDEVAGQNQLKASVQRKIRQSIAEEYPSLDSVLEDLLPKKSPIVIAKCPNHVSIVVMNNVPLFFNVRDGPFMPTLRLLHQYPDMMRKMQVDRGAIKFVMSGANIMCPGLTSPGGKMDDGIPTDSPVAIFAEGKENALAIGYTKMSSDDMPPHDPSLVFLCKVFFSFIQLLPYICIKGVGINHSPHPMCSPFIPLSNASSPVARSTRA